MTTADAAWRDALAALLRRAPDEFRELASDALHIGGFTNVRLEHPVLDLRGVADEARADRALAFFAAAALLHGAAIARVHVRREDASALPRRAKRALRGAITRITALSSWMRISTSAERPTVSIQNGRLTCLRNSTDSAWSSSEKNGFGPTGGMSPTGRNSTTRPSRSWAMRRRRAVSGACGYSR